MVYAGKIGSDRFSFGVSGRLKDENLVMWDEETNSLWSQIKGEALYGDSEGKRLSMLPAVFVSLGTWSRMHPDTKVLDMSTVRSRGWYYTSDDLAAGTVEARTLHGRPKTYELALGVRDEKRTFAVPLSILHDRSVVQDQLGAQHLTFVWHATEKAAFVYETPLGNGKPLELELEDGELRAGDSRWNPLTGEPVEADAEAEPLRRFPYVPTSLTPWRSFYPDGRVLR